MQAYMKTEMPFYGIHKPFRVPVYREIKSRFPIRTLKQYREATLTLWNLPHREEKYAAIHLAGAWPEFITASNVPTYRRLIVNGAWWDLVDGIAIDLVGGAYQKNRNTLNPKIDQWIDHQNLWLRRTAIICQIKHKNETDETRLFDFCLRRAHEKQFFMRKAIGWALRAHSYTNPKAVQKFLRTHEEKLAGLSIREGAKQLKRIGKW